MHLHKTSRIEILRHLAKRGHEVFLIALHSRKKHQPKTTDIPIISIPLRYVPYLSSVVYVLLLFLFLPFYLVRLNPDIIITEPRDVTVFGLTSILLFPRCRRPKVVLDIRSTPVSFEHMKRLLFNTTVCIAKKLFDGITIITPMMKEEICNKFHIDPKSVGVWSDGVSATLFKPENYNETTMRKRLGLHDNFVIFYHGSLSKGRGIPESIKSIKILESSHPNIVLFLLGEGKALPGIREQIQKSGVQDRVIIHDVVDYEDVPKFIAMCDVGIVPLPNMNIWRHQCPLNLLEYLAMKKVVIATDIPANRQVMEKSKCGIYISSPDPEEISKAMIYAYDNKEKLREWGLCGRAIIEEKYTWEKVAEDFEGYALKL